MSVQVEKRGFWLALVLASCGGPLGLADGPLAPDDTARALRVPDGLEASVFAAEPMISNPTNIAVDARGRVWACDVVNYRGHQGKRAEGDRILILQDDDADGRADQVKTFYQGTDVDSALGILPLGDRVIVSCSPNVWIFFDDDGDDRADRKIPLFTKTGRQQHDHSAHAFVVGPDDKLYWNMGNTHEGVFDAAGRPVRDQRGRLVAPDGKPFREGMAFRCAFDGSQFDVLAHNYRNSYELTVGAFGDVWFSDNDDDGNQSTRICYGLDGGNYGYADEMTGRSWNTVRRTGVETEIPQRHWHQNDPGSIPNVANAGSGAPSGIQLYEGELLGEARRGALVHCEPGRNVVRLYAPRPEKSGYVALPETLIDGAADPWFRPVDVASAPDGSLLVADWYDPGVGGHGQADSDRGRIYRLAPPGVRYQAASLDKSSAASCAAALANACDAVRREASQALVRLGKPAFARVRAQQRDPDPRRRAWAMWWLVRSAADRDAAIAQALADADENVRMAALRASRDGGVERVARSIETLIDDDSPRVRAACAVELQRLDDERAPPLWARLALQHQAGDRWSIEALGLAADGRWDACWEAWRALAGSEAERTDAGREITWRSRGAQSMGRLCALLQDPATPAGELVRLLRALDFQDPADREVLLTDLASSAARMPGPRGTLLLAEALRRWREPIADGSRRALLEQACERVVDRAEVAEFIMQFRVAERYGRLFDDILGAQADPSLSANRLPPDSPDQPLASRVVAFLLAERQLDLFQQTLATPGPTRDRVIQLLARSSDAAVVDVLWPIAISQDADVEARREALRAVASNRRGAERLVGAAEAGKLPHDALVALAFALKATPFDQLTQRATALCPDLPDESARQLPVAEWMQMRGSPDRGKSLFFSKANCSTCHRVGQEGQNVGPALSEIGGKLSRTAMYEAVLYPSAAISHNYESYRALTEEGTTVVGVLVDQNEASVRLRTEKGVDQELARGSLETLEKLSLSLMPSGIEKTITPQELADVVAWMETLGKAQP